MTDLPVVTARQLLRALERAGFYIHHVKGSNYYLKHPRKPALRVSVPYHSGDLKRGTLRSILKQADISIDDLNRLL